MKLIAILASLLLSVAAFAQTSAEEGSASQVALFGVSTNALQDLITAVNLGVEVPLGNRWSVRAEYFSPWWSIAGSSYVLKTQNLNIGARYYFHPWTDRGAGVLRGWFVSAEAGAGIYDVCWNSVGSSGRGIHGNIGGGYSFALGDWWRLDLSAGIGMMISDYQRYQLSAGDGTKVVSTSGIARIPDPTSLKVSFVYLFHTKRK